MSDLAFVSQYDKHPEIKIRGHDDAIFNGIDMIRKHLMAHRHGVLCLECYPGVDLDVLKKDLVTALQPDLVINMEDYSKSGLEIDDMIKDNLTEDRVFGYMSDHRIGDFYKEADLMRVKQLIKPDDFVIIYGFGASLLPCKTLVHIG
ncbi:MAG: hypothetical protein EA375_00035, partial [Acholeplasmataceae bacterium]